MSRMMKAMRLEKLADLTRETQPLTLTEVAIPEPGPGQVRIRISTCGVCHTELDEIEGRTPPPILPMTLGHQAVGRIDRLGPGVEQQKLDEKVGVAWIYSACGACHWCKTERENLCPEFQATGRDADGGYAEYMVAPADFVHPIPAIIDSAVAAPLLCAGAIGYRSLRLAQLQPGAPLGLTGFGASAHLVLKLVRHLHPELSVFVFARNEKERVFARELGAAWAGDAEQQAPQRMQAIIDTTPAWKPVVCALRQLEPGGRLVINAIRKESLDNALLADIDYPQDLWMEKIVQSVANVTTRDVREFLEYAAEIPITPTFQEYSLEQANQALLELKQGIIRGAKVLRIAED